MITMKNEENLSDEVKDMRFTIESLADIIEREHGNFISDLMEKEFIFATSVDRSIIIKKLGEIHRIYLDLQKSVLEDLMSEYSVKNSTFVNTSGCQDNGVTKTTKRG